MCEHDDNSSAQFTLSGINNNAANSQYTQCTVVHTGRTVHTQGIVLNNTMYFGFSGE